MHDEETIDLLAYARRLTRFMMPAAVAGLVAMLAVVALSLLAKPTVHMKAHVLVQPPASAPAEAGASADADMLSRTMRTYVALEDLPQLVELASKNTNGKFTPKQVADKTEIFWGGGSFLLAVKAEADDPDDAKLLANAMADALAKEGPNLLKRQKDTVPVMSVIERAKVDDDPTLPKQASTISRILPGIAAGVVVALLTAVVLEALASRRRPVATTAPRTPLAQGEDPTPQDD